MAKNTERKAARAELDAVAARDRATGNREETPEYWAANERVTAAENSRRNRR